MVPRSLKHRSFSVSAVKSLMKFSWVALAAVAKVFSSDIGNGRICGTSRRVNNSRIYDGSGVGKNSLGEMDATSSLAVQSLPDSADRITITTEYANVPT